MTTLKEAHEQLDQLFPNNSYCLTMSNWSMGRGHNSPPHKSLKWDLWHSEAEHRIVGTSLEAVLFLAHEWQSSASFKAKVLEVRARKQREADEQIAVQFPEVDHAVSEVPADAHA